MMLSLTYMSTATTPLESEELAALLQQSRENNERCNMTGMLLYKNGRFMQVLEGAENDVRERYAVISTDPRHTDVKLLLDESIEQRRFPQWSMGAPASTDLRKAPGYSSFFESTAERRSSRTDFSRTHALLDWFRRRA